MKRRAFLRGSGALIALPFLESLGPRLGLSHGIARAAEAAAPPRRMLLIMSNMGVIPRNFFPETPGRDYESTPYLDILSKHRDRFTVCSGLSHPDVGGAHATEKSFLNAAPHPGRSTFKNTISMDQFAVEQTATVTRFPSLALIVGYNTGGMPSTTRDGVQIPPERDPAVLYRKLFVQGTPEEVDRRIDDLGRGASILDFVLDDARRLEQNLPLPGPRYVSDLVPSCFADDRVYLTVDGHRSDDFATYVFVSNDRGASWRDLGLTLPSLEPKTRAAAPPKSASEGVL